MSKKHTEETLPGLVKTVTARRKFVHLGHTIEQNETFETDAESVLELANQRLIDPYSIGGGSFELTPENDGYHKISPWGTHFGNIAGEPWLRVQFLVDVSGLLVKAGDKRRLRRSQALSFPYIYRSDGEVDQSNRTRSINFVPALVIHELRPNRLPQDVIEARMASVLEGKAREEAGAWMKPTMATPTIPQA
jgi:hypothetical protein